MTHEASQFHSTEQNSSLEFNLGFKPGTYEITQAEMEAMVPKFFTQPEGVAVIAPKTRAEIQQLTPEKAKIELDKLPFVRRTAAYLTDGLPDPFIHAETMTYTNEASFQIPVARIVGAEGLEGDSVPSWAGWGAGRAYKEGKPAIETVIDYAKRGPYEHGEHAINKIDVNVFFAPNGEVFYGIGNDGIHRAAAAKLRGDETLQVHSMIVRKPEVSTLSDYDVSKIYGQDESDLPEPRSEQPPELSTVEKFMQDADQIETGQMIRVGDRQLAFEDNVYAANKDGSRVATLVFRHDDGSKLIMSVEDYLRQKEAFDAAHRETFEELGEAALSPETGRSRSDLLFAPVVEKHQEANKVFDYSFLVDSDAKQLPGGVEAAAVRPEANVRTRVTPETEKDAEDMFKQAAQVDEKLNDILADYVNKQHKLLSPKDIVTAARTDEGLRKTIGDYLLGKLNQLAKEGLMPKRATDNTQKNTKAPGYDIPGLKSREYTALLALGMLDGTFDDRIGESEDYDPNTDKGGGQHRYAARQLLLTRL